MNDILKVLRDAAHPDCTDAFNNSDETCCIGCWRMLTAATELELLRRYVDVYDSALEEESALADSLYSLLIRMDPDNGYILTDEEYEFIMQSYEDRRGE